MIARPALLLPLSLALPACPAAAAPAVPLRLEGHLMVEARNSDGPRPARQVLREVPAARSGDRLLFVVRYENRGARPVQGLDLVAPVPRGVRILPDRARMVSISPDGGHSWFRPDAPFRVDGDGRLRPAPDLLPTHVRLRLPVTVAPGESGTAVYRGELL